MSTIIFGITQQNQIEILSDAFQSKILMQKGVYDVVRFTSPYSALYLTAHLERFVSSAKHEKLNIPYTLNEIKHYLYECIRNITFSSFRIKFFLL